MCSAGTSCTARIDTRHSSYCSTICASTGGCADHQVVGQQHREGLVADQPLAAQHGMAQAQGLGLANVDALHVVGLDAAHNVQ